MNKEKIAEAFGRIDDKMITDALDYKCERRITMSAKKILIIAAIVATIACMAIPMAAEPTLLVAWGKNGEFVENGHYYESFYEASHYFGSLKDGTAVIAEEGSVEITAVEVEEGTVKFVIEADTSVAPFDEYGELNIFSWGLYDMVQDKIRCESAGNPFGYGFGNGANGYYSADITGGLAFKDYRNDNMDIVLSKLPINGVYCDVQQYKLIIYGIAGRNADGEVLEIRGEWEAEFTF